MLLKGKKGIIFGALDERSIAWKVAEKCKDNGAKFTLTNAPIALRMGKINELAENCNTKVIPADITDINDLETVFYNPAGLINVEPYCLIAGTTDLYGLNFLNHQFLSVSLPSNSAFSIQQLGTNSGGSSDKNLSSEKSISFSKAFYLLDDEN